jgi:hypothetical protein
VAVVVVIAWLAARASEYSQQLSSTRNELTQATQTVGQMQQRTAALDAEVARLRSPGRTTVILRAAAPARRGAAQDESGAWGAATWGEQPDGKTWVRLDAYGVAPAPQGKVLALWLEPAAGAPVLVTKLDPAPDGSAFAEGKDLPAVDQGKRLIVSVDDEDAKKPGQAMMQADLPKLKASQAAQAQAQPSRQGQMAAQGAVEQKAGQAPADGAAQEKPK